MAPNLDATTKTCVSTYHQGLLGDALAEKIVEMHESCAESGLEGGDAAGPTGGSGGRRESGGTSKDLASAATPKEYVSFLRSWFDMHESKKARLLLHERVAVSGLLCTVILCVVEWWERNIRSGEILEATDGMQLRVNVRRKEPLSAASCAVEARHAWDKR